MPLDCRKLAEDTKNAQVKFLLTDLAAGLTFATLARQGGTGDAKSRSRARAAYNSALRFLDRAHLTHEEAEEVRVEMKILRQRLEELGETF